MVPNGWERVPLEEVAEVRTGVAKNKKKLEDPVELPYLRVANVQDGRLDLNEIKTIEIERRKIERYSLVEGDVLMTEGGDFDKLGRGDVWNSQIPQCLHQNHVFVVRVKNDVLSPYFLSALSGSAYGKNYFLSCAKRSTNLASINSSQLKKFPVIFPALKEQQRIMEVIHVWDEAISSVERLLCAVGREKIFLMRKLLNFERGLEKARWANFDDVFARVVRKNTVLNENVLTISAQKGLVSQLDYFNKPVASNNLSTYTLLERGDFAYNKSYSSGYPMGAIKPLVDAACGVVSSLYICFELKDEASDSHDYYRHYFESGCHNDQISSIAQEGARNHGLLNVGIGDFFGLSVFRPSYERQNYVSGAINCVEEMEKKYAAQKAALIVERSALFSGFLNGGHLFQAGRAA